MFDRMPPEKLAQAKAKTGAANETARLARAANGHGTGKYGVTGAERRSADEQLVRTYGEKKAAKLKEDALVSVGAEPKGLRRWFG